MRNGFIWLKSLYHTQNNIELANTAFKDVFNLENPTVRIVLKDLANYCHIYSSSFVSKDSHQTAFNEGARDVMLHLMEMLELDLDTLIKLNKEI